MKSDGKPLPEFSLPSMQLFGKDGHEIKITAQVDLQLQADVRQLLYQCSYSLTVLNIVGH
jgi:hypothetical protein